MKYVLLAYNDEGMLGAMPPGERATFGEACAANDEALRRSGRLLAAERTLHRAMRELNEIGRKAAS